MNNFYFIELFDCDDKCIFSKRMISAFSISESSFFCVLYNGEKFYTSMFNVSTIKVEVM
jgi:hypothetical protein